MPDGHHEPTPASAEHTHDEVVHTHPHFHVTHNHNRMTGGFDHLFSEHSHEHDHASLTHSHIPHEDFEHEHLGEAHVLDHGAPVRKARRARKSAPTKRAP